MMMMMMMITGGGGNSRSWTQQIGDGIPFGIRAKWSKASRRWHSRLTQRISALSMRSDDDDDDGGEWHEPAPKLVGDAVQDRVVPIKQLPGV